MKTVSKSFRLTPGTIALIESWPGNSFTEKFENLINDAYLNRDRHEQRVRDLERQRDELLRQIHDLQSVKNGLIRLRDSINRSYNMTIEVEKTAKQISDCTQRIARCDHD